MGLYKANKETLDKLPGSTVKAHILLAYLISQGYLEEEEFLILTKGSRTRAYLGEITEIAYRKVHTASKLERLLIAINQEGVFDMLPEGLHYQTFHSDAFDSINTYVKETKLQRKERENARKFFAPFEQESHNLRIAIADQEIRDSSTLGNPIVRNILRGFWEDDLGGEFSERDIDVMIYLLPLVHRATADMGLLSRCFELALEAKVELSIKQNKRIKIAAHIVPVLGAASLGYNTILGDTIRPVGGKLHLKIGPISRNRIPQFLPNGIKINLLNWLRRFFIPYEREFGFSILLKKREEFFMLNEDSFLGYSTTII